MQLRGWNLLQAIGIRPLVVRATEIENNFCLYSLHLFVLQIIIYITYYIYKVKTILNRRTRRKLVFPKLWCEKLSGRWKKESLKSKGFRNYDDFFGHENYVFLCTIWIRSFGNRKLIFFWYYSGRISRSIKECNKSFKLLAISENLLWISYRFCPNVVNKTMHASILQVFIIN